MQMLKTQITSTGGGGYHVVLGMHVSFKGRLRECDHQLQLLEELSIEKGIMFILCSSRGQNKD